MSETERVGETSETAAGLEAQMDAELDALRAKGPSAGGPVRNPVFQHEQRAGTAAEGSEATLTAARATGEMAAEADQERPRIEAEVARVERDEPGSAAARDAESAKTRAEHDADETVDESLDSDEAAEDSRAAAGTRHLHRGADPDRVLADERRALADESVAGRDLADLDVLEARVEGDGAGASPAG